MAGFVPSATAAEQELQHLRQLVERQQQAIDGLRRALGPVDVQPRIVRVGPVLPQRPEAPPSPRVPAIDSYGWWPASIWPETPLVPPPGLASMSTGGESLPTTAVVVFGLTAEELAAVVKRIASRQHRSRDFKPVFLTNATDFAPFRSAGYAFEFLPREVYGAFPHLGLTPEAASRMRLLGKKWDFASVIDLTRRPPAETGAGSNASLPSSATIPESTDDQVALVRASGLFDEEWYTERYPEVRGTGIDPIRHYLVVGAAKGYDPSPLFRTGFYVRQMAAGDDLTKS